MTVVDPGPFVDAQSGGGPSVAGPLVLLQSLCLPGAEAAMPAALCLQRGAPDPVTPGVLALPAGAAADFGTYVNLLDLATWTGHCRLAGLWLRLAGTGRIRLQPVRLTGGAMPGPGRPTEPPARQTLPAHELDLAPGGVMLDLAGWLPAEGRGADPAASLVALEMTALTDTRLTGGGFLTAAPESQHPVRLAIAITTFRREAQVAATVARLTAFLDSGALETPAHLFVIDNGQTLGQTLGHTLAPHHHLTCLPNRNLGGAGGFARGLAAATDGGFSHALFMDDDASFPLENLIRTAAFLRLARDPAAALAGAMISEAEPDRMWENGAVFDRWCRPQHHGMDLTDPADVAALLTDAARPKPRGFYGGWWYFGFPLAGVRRWPYPFFVRGDDISFSLANGFATATLNGVMSFQEAFAAKESPQTLYLDLRNHLHHHLAQDGMEIGARATAGIVWRFVTRSLVRMHYDSATAQLQAFADVMAGPGFFAANADMAARRASIAAATRDEIWRPDTRPSPPAATPPSLAFAYLMKLTLNGHLVPFWRHLGRQVTLDIGQRAPVWPLWGAAALRYVDGGPAGDGTGGRSYALRHSKRRFAALVWQLAKLSLRWRRLYPGLRAAYRADYPQTAARAFWDGQFAGAGAPAALVTPPAMVSVMPSPAPRPESGAGSGGAA